MRLVHIGAGKKRLVGGDQPQALGGCRFGAGEREQRGGRGRGQLRLVYIKQNLGAAHLFSTQGL